MIMVCSSCETLLMLGLNIVDCQFGWEAKEKGSGIAEHARTRWRLCAPYACWTVADDPWRRFGAVN